MRLRCGGTTAPQGIQHRDAGPATNGPGEKFSLIVTAVPATQGVKWHGNKRVGSRALKAWILQPEESQLGERLDRPLRTVVFEPMDQFPDGSLASGDGHGALEMKVSPAAIGAYKGTLKGPIKRMRTNVTTRWADPSNFLPALLTPISGGNGQPAPHAMGG